MAVASSQGQDFTNLNFESAQVIPSYTNTGRIFISITNALSGWSAFDGTNQLSSVQYIPPPGANPGLLPPIALEGSNAYVIDGNFSILLGSSSISISQTGLVPSGTESLLFDATSPSPLVLCNS
jgi:hypothetical protein